MVLVETASVKIPRDAVQTGARRLHDAARGQLQNTMLALALALCVAPLAVGAERGAFLLRRALLGDSVAEISCGALIRADEVGFAFVCDGCVATLLSSAGVVAAVYEVSVRAAAFIRHLIVVGIAMFALVLWSIVVGRPRGVNMVYYAMIGAYSMIQASHLSFTLWRSLTARRKSVRLFVAGVVTGVGVSITTVALGCLSGFYVILSNTVQGTAGVVINGACDERFFSFGLLCLAQAPTVAEISRRTDALACSLAPRRVAQACCTRSPSCSSVAASSRCCAQVSRRGASTLPARSCCCPRCSRVRPSSSSSR
jgi:hypothetical protein